MTKILALDASTTAVGWVLAEDDACILSGTFKPKGDWLERVDQIHNHFLRAIHMQSVEVILYEEPHGDHGNQSTDYKLGFLAGVLYRMCKDAKVHHSGKDYMEGRSVEFVAIHGSKVKATEYSKDNTWAAAALIGQDPDKITEDEADAVGVWMAYNRMKLEERMIANAE